MLRYLLYILYFLCGVSLGVWLFPDLISILPADLPAILNNALVHALIGGLLFLTLFYWSIDKVEQLIRKGEGILLNRNLPEIIFATLGMVIGLVVAVLISLLLNTLNIPIVSEVISFALAIILGYLGFQIGMKKHSEVLELLPKQNVKEQQDSPQGQKKLLDTSAIIDGRIVDVVKTGFIEGELSVPQFVLDELQLIADSTDSVKRDRGQRGLEMLRVLQESSENVNIQPVKYDKLDVDQQLVQLAKEENAALITTDYNLNRVCQVHNIKVLNVNELSDAIKLIIKQGDTMDIMVTKHGKEEDQGVGYLEDGTMVVIEDGRKLVNQTVSVEVTSVLQTNSGRIIFTKKES
ncbi:PIN/TRAM domain-containing protein [Salinicoccus sp. YB14-2]|uniref:PIN/TRAM domain-containing protein n=1 Tax=Salinicoccus sp. YB14-2 TaxID=1572701 RepID=UPI00069026A5|nr:PIN domain-containing protein [Salinicoccus sp. YB14-2]